MGPGSSPDPNIYYRTFLFCYKNPCGPKLTAQQLGIAVEHRACNTAAQCSFDICRSIVNEETFFGLQAKFFQTQPINFQLRLDNMVICRNQLPVKETAGRNPGPVVMLANTGIGQQVDAIAQKWYITTEDGLYVANLDGQYIMPIDAEATGAICVDAARSRLYWASKQGLKAMPLIKSKNNQFATTPELYNTKSDIDRIVVNNNLQ